MIDTLGRKDRIGAQCDKQLRSGKGTDGAMAGAAVRTPDEAFSAQALLCPSCPLSACACGVTVVPKITLEA